MLVFVIKGVLTHEFTELSVLLARMIFPLHLICAAIQSIGITRRDVENDSHCKLGRGILLPAVILHGAFDSVLFVGDFLNANVWAVVLALLIFVAGVVYYFLEAKKQRQRLQSRDLQINVDQSSLI